MPTAHEYRNAALHLRRIDARLVHGWTLVRIATGPDHIVGGPVRALLARGLDTANARVERARLELARLEANCERRAEICARFAADLRRHQRVVAMLGSWTPPPAPPAWWAEP